MTGLLLPGGDVKSETKTKVEREHAPDTTMKEKAKGHGVLPQLRVISVKQSRKAARSGHYFVGSKPTADSWWTAVGALLHVESMSRSASTDIRERERRYIVRVV